MSNDAATLLVGASTDFLRNFSPFNRMEAEALAFVAERAVLAFHARGSDILTPEMGVPRYDALPIDKYDAAIAWIERKAAELLPGDPDAVAPCQETFL